jgi:Tol biopolymer transport system component/tRNA A-37 threonylcarbamoyl transferase component Bud32
MNTRLGAALEGRYSIDREVGRGGMATVYLARDVRHHRRVALKVLNPELGAVLGPERFLAEIEVTANLQHPNLLPLFDSGEADGLLFYVMPYVEGESLRARLEREKQLPVDEAVRIAVAIAGALDYAHRNKVIHRDLKPENILMQEGQPLIADFGIALAVSNAGGARITQTGLSLGTPQYMSPEQATGDRVVDGRTDIYSLGAILYEMLVGDPPHAASTSQAIIAKVLTEKPGSARTSRPSVPPHVDAGVARALEKLAADRFATAREFADAVQGRGLVATAAYEPTRPAARASGGRRARELAAWSLVAAFAAYLGWQQLTRSAPEAPPVIRANFDLPPNARINDAIVGSTIAVSPAGDMIAFTSIGVSGFRMYIRRVNEIAAREIGDANIAGRNLTFSPDGRWLAFTEGNVLKKIGVDGGQAATLGSTGGTVPYGTSWGSADTIYIGGFSGMWKVPATGGAPQLIVKIDSGEARAGRRWPYVLPGAKRIVFSSGNSSTATPKLGVLEISSGEISEYDPVLAMPLGIVDDQLVYVSPTGGLMAVRFDVEAGKPTGQPVQMDEGILIDPTAGAKASLSSSGTLIYLKGRAEFQPVVAGAGSGGGEAIIREPGTYSNPRYSPDGRRVAMAVMGATGSDIWIYDIPRNTFTRLTSDGTSVRPEWSPDGRSVVFISNGNARGVIRRQLADGSGPAELLYQPEQEPFEVLISPDNRWLVYRTAPGATFSRDILAVPLTGERTVTPLVTGPNTESLPRLSPDGQWLAYQSNETGRFEIYVRPFPGSGARVQVSDIGGTEAIWGRDGRSLHYRGPLGEVVRADVTTGASFSIGKRQVMLTGDYLTDSSHPNWDVAPDGRFLMLKRAGAESQTIVVHNWVRELREKTGPRR